MKMTNLIDTKKMKAALLNISPENKVKFFPILIMEGLTVDIKCMIFDDIINKLNDDNVLIIYNFVNYGGLEVSYA